MIRCYFTGIACDECTEENFEECDCNGNCSECLNAEEDEEDD
ncbi:hypothetical protein RBG61_02050 [Paludicola sp. MB14-C6]|nr:hypothetical protein [Paludicola sp. MB14-C6]WMJ23474.1 hypothetical protein RBG61_02050 [Paludicola sp. MB14-C6]